MWGEAGWPVIENQEDGYVVRGDMKRKQTIPLQGHVKEVWIATEIAWETLVLDLPVGSMAWRGHHALEGVAWVRAWNWTWRKFWFLDVFEDWESSMGWGQERNYRKQNWGSDGRKGIPEDMIVWGFLIHRGGDIVWKSFQGHQQFLAWGKNVVVFRPSGLEISRLPLWCLEISEMLKRPCDTGIKPGSVLLNLCPLSSLLPNDPWFLIFIFLVWAVPGGS